MVPFLLFLILLAIIGGGALVGNFFLLLGGIIAALLLLVFLANMPRKTWGRIGLGILAVVCLIAALNWQRLAYGPCMKLYRNPDTGDIIGHPYGTDKVVKVNPDDHRLAYWLKCSK